MIVKDFRFCHCNLLKFTKGQKTSNVWLQKILSENRKQYLGALWEMLTWHILLFYLAWRSKKLFTFLIPYLINYLYMISMHCWTLRSRTSEEIDLRCQPCKANQWTGFYVIRTSAMKELIHINKHPCSHKLSFK